MQEYHNHDYLMERRKKGSLKGVYERRAQEKKMKLENLSFGVEPLSTC